MSSTFLVGNERASSQGRLGPLALGCYRSLTARIHLFRCLYLIEPPAAIEAPIDEEVPILARAALNRHNADPEHALLYADHGALAKWATSRGIHESGGAGDNGPTIQYGYSREGPP